MLKINCYRINIHADSFYDCILYVLTCKIFMSFIIVACHQMSTEYVICTKAQNQSKQRYWMLYRARGLFLESPSSSSGLESYFVFAVFTFRVKVSINIFYNDTMKLSVNKQNWLVCDLGTVQYYSTSFDFKIFPLGPKGFQAFRETGPRLFKAGLR